MSPRLAAATAIAAASTALAQETSERSPGAATDHVAGEEDALGVAAVLALVAADPGEGGRGRRLGGDRPARPARLHRTWRARPPRSSHAVRYRRRREALLETLARLLPQARATMGGGGLYELIELPEGIDEAALVVAAAERGVGVDGLSLHRFDPGGPPGLVLGFACMAEPAMDHGIRLLAEATQSLEGRAPGL